jgi:hypothetical protein
LTRPAAAKRTKKADKPVVVQSVKGFDGNLACRGYQFELGNTYEHDGPVKACEGGFHACTLEQHPLEVFGYYSPAGSRYCLVEQSGEIHTDDQVKIASAKITVGVELSLNELIVRAVEWVFARAKKEKILETATGTRGAASATGDYGAASATGNYGAASATGTRGAASATGNYGAASATGYQGAASATGYQGAASATGYQGAASATGNYGAASATGNYGAASATGKKSTAMACGYAGKVSGKAGNALFALERDDNYNIISTASGIVGKDGIEADTFYRCVGGKLVRS